MRGKLAIELGENRDAVDERSSAPADVSAEFFSGVAPCTMKLAPGSPRIRE
jgi:hypothetical protein